MSSLQTIEAPARQIWAQPDILTETGGVLAGAWFAHPPMRFGHDLIAAGISGAFQSSGLTNVGATTMSARAKNRPRRWGAGMD
jgi:hypothetical protein